jgi:hypothetical protein
MLTVALLYTTDFNLLCKVYTEKASVNKTKQKQQTWEMYRILS